MLRADLRRIADRQRVIVRRQLATFLAWALRHACERADLMNRKLTQLTLEQAAAETCEELYRLADRGAFVYFGIGSGYELGAVPIVVEEIRSHVGRVAIANVNQAIDYIARGGLRGRGWIAPSALTVDDLAK